MEAVDDDVDTEEESAADGEDTELNLEDTETNEESHRDISKTLDSALLQCSQSFFSDESQKEDTVEIESKNTSASIFIIQSKSLFI